MFKSLIFSSQLLLAASFTFGQLPTHNPGHIKPDDYRQDFRTLSDNLRKTYPSLYRFHDKAQTDQFLDSCYHSLNSATNDISFYAMVKFVLRYFGDGHISSSPSAKLKDIFQNDWEYFPLSLIFLKDKVYNYCNNTSVPGGAEILSINNVPVSNIKSRLLKYITGDGSIETGKNYTLNRSFWFYYNLVYGEQTEFRIRYKALNGEIRTGIINSLVRKDFQCSYYEPLLNDPLLQLSFPKEGIALLTIKSFSDDELSSSKLEFPVFLDSVFRVLENRKISKLIIDLRGNGGGADVYGSLLYSYLANKPFRYYESLETSARKLTRSEHPNLDLQQPAENNFQGQVFFLINGLSFSATAEFCAVAKNANRGKFIGEETGGAYCGNTSGGFVHITLPKSQISMAIPTIKYTMAVNKTINNDRGIIPDYEVIPGIADILGGKDSQLDYVLWLAINQ